MESKITPAMVADFAGIMEQLGWDLSQPGLQRTPERYLTFLSEFCPGKEVGFKLTTFPAEGADEMIVQAGIPVMSLCEHHLAPIIGQAVVGYIPQHRIVGLSKLARTVEHFARQLQNQERLTTQVAAFLMDTLQPWGVGVSIRAMHTCMTMRGVRAHGTETTTQCLLGAFKTNSDTRSEFLQRVR